ncbi:DUF5684 domain-containing protein [Anaerofustis stercorihominis]|uniref:Uncharacterized protein n=1 Tax=Anaerofustis stercorihominis TaxID=214853 RepID=A0A3E3DYW1_9FIRM|nr:DUF5684 domain-containing protein [Anaerofustis stercorihominis]RGD74460.1 hypothetical protein DW687_06755 [Anaerofustis stercorihominis]
MILLLFEYLYDFDIFNKGFKYIEDLLITHFALANTFLVLIFIYLIFISIVYYKLYQKLGYEGILFIIPFYSLYLLCKKVISEDRGFLWIICFIPYVRDIFYVYLDYKTGMYFKKSTAFNIGLILLPEVFIPILVFKKDKNDNYYDTKDENLIDGE